MNNRIRKIREALGLNQNDFAQKINLQRNSITLIETGKRNPSDRTISDICSEFNVNENWLRYGEGEMFIKATPELIDQLAVKYQLNDLEYRFLFEYFKLDSKTREAVATYLSNVFNSKAVPIKDAQNLSVGVGEISATAEMTNSIESAEDTYKKSLGIAQKMGYTALNTTKDIGRKAL